MTGASRVPPIRRYAYVGTYTAPNVPPGGSQPSTAVGIYVFELDLAHGSLTPAQVVANLPNPTFLAVDSSQTRLYATLEVDNWNGLTSGGVAAFSIDPQSGLLTLLNSEGSGGAIPALPTLDPGGRYVLVPNYMGASFAVLPILPDGLVGPATSVFPVTGMGPNPARQDAPHPHDIVFDPAGRFVFGADLGTDHLWAWRLDTTTGSLVPASPPYALVASGSGPRHLAFHRTANVVYVVDELVSSITVFDYEPTTGAFTWMQSVPTVPTDYLGVNYPAEIVVAPNGQVVYASNRGHDSIATFAVDGQRGTLSPVGWTSTRGSFPRSFCVDPSGTMLLVANQNSDSIVTYSIDQATGSPIWTGQEFSTPTPVCIVLGGIVPAASG